MSNVQTQSENVAKRVDAQAMGFDPLTIITILNVVLPLLSNCGVKNSSPKPEDMRDYVAKENARNPEQLRKRIARRIRGESDEPLTKEQSLVLADAVVQEALNPTSNDEAINEFVVECKALDPNA
jgi:hypothetical protein